MRGRTRHGRARGATLAAAAIVAVTVPAGPPATVTVPGTAAAARTGSTVARTGLPRAGPPSGGAAVGSQTGASAAAPIPESVSRAGTAVPAGRGPGPEPAATAQDEPAAAAPSDRRAPGQGTSSFTAAGGPTGAPVPPPLTVGPPAGRRPGPAAGLRSPDACTPPAADAPRPDAATPAARLDLAGAHRLATGAGQVVAVIDTGVAPGARLGGRLVGGGDFLTGGAGLEDCDGHGTAVAGILAASDAGRDGGGVVGMAPGARVLAIRQSSPSFTVTGPDGGTRPAGDVRTLAEAIALAVREGATVINISEAVCLPAAQAAVQGASIQAALALAARADVVVVGAAGNTGVGNCAAAGQEQPDQVSLPGWYGGTILTVGAVGTDDAAAPFTVPGPWVDVAAPGTGLRSLAVGGGTTATDVTGTSFAAPWVSGLAALVRERFPRLTAGQVVDRILATARRPAPGQVTALGHGVIDPVAALTALPDVLAADPSPATGSAVLAEAAPARAPSAPPAGAAALVLGVACAGACWTLRPRRPRAGR